MAGAQAGCKPRQKLQFTTDKLASSGWRRHVPLNFVNSRLGHLRSGRDEVQIEEDLRSRRYSRRRKKEEMASVRLLTHTKEPSRPAAWPAGRLGALLHKEYRLESGLRALARAGIRSPAYARRLAFGVARWNWSRAGHKSRMFRRRFGTILSLRIKTAMS